MGKPSTAPGRFFYWASYRVWDVENAVGVVEEGEESAVANSLYHVSMVFG